MIPGTPPLISPGTPIGDLLAQIQGASFPLPSTQSLGTPASDASQASGETAAAADAGARPFLTVVMRTQGRRPHTLAEALLCLSAQTDSDFEVILIGHKLGQAETESVAATLDDTSPELRARINFLPVDEGGRARPLNVGFEKARGEFISILDDDDIPFGQWVENFRQLAADNPGHLLRSSCVRQDVSNASVSGLTGLRAIGPMERLYAPSFDFLDHLRVNLTPGLTIAFPREAFHTFGLRFDEALSTTEDWDFLMRSASLCGVASSSQITCIYRWWPQDESSRTVHSQDEWDINYQAVLKKMDQNVWILPKGSTKRIRELLESQASSLDWVGASATAQPPHFQSRLLRVMARSIRIEIAWLSVKRILYITSKPSRRKYRQLILAYRAALKGIKTRGDRLH